MIKKLLYWSIIVFFVLSSCKSGKQETEEKAFRVPDSINQTREAIKISDEAMESIVENIASPVEMAALVKSIGSSFSKEYLASAQNTDRFESEYAQAFNLGVYGADLGYINMYQKQSLVLDYLQSIKKLSNEVNVGQFFDFATLKKLAENNQNMDSLMYISVHSFNEMNDYLRKHNRSDVGAVIIAGAWVEGIYLLTQVADKKSSEKLRQAIGEQKTVLNELMLILDNYRQQSYVSDLIKHLKKLQAEFYKINITIEAGEPKSVVKDGKLTIIQNEKSQVHLSNQLLKDIIAKSKKIRNTLINLE